MNAARVKLLGSIVARLAATFLIVACADDEDLETIEPKAGSRLVPMYRSALGASIFDGWFDRELQVRCRLGTTEDGKTRCLPEGQAYTAFLDETCQTPVTVTCGQQAFGTKGFNWFNVKGVQLTPITAPTSLFVQESDCKPRHFGSRAVVSQATPAPDSSFVEMQPITVVVSDELELVVLTGSDGSLSPANWRDRKRGQFCMPMWTDSGRRCLPGSYALAPNLYSDASCTMPVFPYADEGKPNSILAMEDPGAPGKAPLRDPFDGRVMALFEFANAPASAPTFIKTPSGCHTITPSVGTPLRRVAIARFDSRAFPKLDTPNKNAVISEHHYRVGRQPVVLAYTPTRMLKPGSKGCHIRTLADGRAACIEAKSAASIYPGDEQCPRKYAVFHDPFEAPQRVLMGKGDGTICGQASTTTASLTPLAATNTSCPPNPEHHWDGSVFFEIGEEQGLLPNDFVLGESMALPANQ